MPDIQQIAWFLTVLITVLALFIGIAPFFLIKPLNRKFDPDLLEHVHPLQYFAGISSRATRAGLYAALVFSKKIFARNQKHYQDYDFRSKISRKVYIFCSVYTIIWISTLLVIAPLTYFTLKRAESQRAAPVNSSARRF